MMVTISYEYCVFRVTDLYFILERLYYYLSQQKNVKELFDPIVFKFVIFDLIKQRKGIKIFCKNCDLDFFPDQISLKKIGTNADPQSIETKWDLWTWMKGLFERKKPEMKKIGRFGGEKAICPKGHELLSVVRWIS